jgi:hypothetical protein
MQTTYRGVIRTKRESFERNTVQGQTGVPAQERGGGGGVGAHKAEIFIAHPKIPGVG